MFNPRSNTGLFSSLYRTKAWKLHVIGSLFCELCVIPGHPILICPAGYAFDLLRRFFFPFYPIFLVFIGTKEVGDITFRSLDFSSFLVAVR